MTVSKKILNKGWYGQSSDDEAFLRPSNQDYYQASASGVGYSGERGYDDNAGTRDLAGYGVDGADNSAAFLEPSTTFYDSDYPHQALSGLIDNQADLGSGNKLTGGGGDVSKNKYGGVGYGPPTHRPKNVGAAGQNNRDARGGRGGRR